MRFLLKIILYPWWVSSHFIYFWSLWGLFSHQFAFLEKCYVSCNKYTIMTFYISFCFTKYSCLMNEIAWKIKCKKFNTVLPDLSYLFLLAVKMPIPCRTVRNNGYMLIWLINSLGVHGHTWCKVVGGDQKGAFNKSCGNFYKFDKYLVLEMYNFKWSSDKLAKSHKTAQQ